MTTPKPPTILVVEDHPGSRKLIKSILTSADYSVLTAHNGEEALNLIHSHPEIDLVLLDIIMPGMNGYQVCQTIRADDRTHELPVIFLTVLEEAHDESRGFEVGVSDYIIKPISRLRLLARIKNLLAVRQKQREVEDKNQQLQQALDQIKTLQGILPICSFCKKIRNDLGAWQQLEDYIQSHSEAQFSHSVCPNCAQQHYPDYHRP